MSVPFLLLFSQFLPLLYQTLAHYLQVLARAHEFAMLVKIAVSGVFACNN